MLVVRKPLQAKIPVLKKIHEMDYYFIKLSCLSQEKIGFY